MCFWSLINTTNWHKIKSVFVTLYNKPEGKKKKMASTEPKHEHREDEEAPTNDDEDTRAQVTPIIKLEEVAVTTGEEDETSILDL